MMVSLRVVMVTSVKYCGKKKQLFCKAVTADVRKLNCYK